MITQRINSADYTDMTNVVTDYEVSNQDTDFNDYTPNWTKWLGYYMSIPEVQAVIDKKAIWTVGKGFKSDEKISKILKNISGNGKDTFNSIMLNLIRGYTICGDSFAEIVKTKKGLIKNLKPINPGSITIISDKYGIIKKYEQRAYYGEVINKFNPENIFHLSWNRLADSSHGIGVIEKIENIILARNESLSDLKKVFHRYVKPLIVSEVDTDDSTEIATYKAKLDHATEYSENMVIPKGTATMERISIPNNSTLDPLPYLKTLQQYFIQAEGVPEVILGHGDNTTEATSKIVYLAFQQMIEWNQLFIEEQIKSQLGIEVEFNFPESIAPELQTQQSKANNLNNMEVGIHANK